MTMEDFSCRQCDGLHQHEWVEVEVFLSSNVAEVVSRCRVCGGRRCSSLGDPNPCILRRHHTEPHLMADGTIRRVGA